MRRWHRSSQSWTESEDIDNFLTELKQLCKKYNIGISHEDGFGAFEFEEYSESNWEWIEQAVDTRVEKH